MYEERQNEMQEEKANEATQKKEHEHEKRSISVWVSWPHEEAILLVEEALGSEDRIYSGTEPPPGKAPSSVLLCLKGEGVTKGMRRVRALAPDVPILVFGQRGEPRLAEEALRAKASGFVHAGMRPEQVARALSLVHEGEIVIPRELLGELLGRRLFLRRPKLLDL